MVGGTNITRLGRALIAKVLATGSTLHFTKATVGSGELPVGTALDDVTALFSHKAEAQIASVSSPSPGQCKLVLQLLTDGIAEGFYVREIGVFAQDPDLGEILYCYTYLEVPEWMRPAGDAIEKMFNIELVTIVSSVQSVTADISPEALVRRSELQNYALRVHTHIVSDIIGLGALLSNLQDSVTLINDLVSGAMQGGHSFYADLLALSNVTVNDGCWNADQQSITA